MTSWYQIRVVFTQLLALLVVQQVCLGLVRLLTLRP